MRKLLFISAIIFINLIILFSCKNIQSGQQETEPPAKHSSDAHASEINGYTARINENRAQLERDSDQLTLIKLNLDSLQADANVAGQKLADDSVALIYYVLDHKMASAAIIAGAVSSGPALDFKNKFSKDDETFNQIVLAAAAIWALGHMDEVMDVLSEFGKFSTDMDYQTNIINRLRSQYQVLLSHQETLRNEVADLEAKNKQYLSSIAQLRETDNL
jgi:hypothetical protein